MLHSNLVAYNHEEDGKGREKRERVEVMNREGLGWQGAWSNYNIIQNLIRPPP